MIYIGCDPGQRGGYAWIWDGKVTVHPWDDQTFVQNMHMLSLCADKPIAAVEKVGAMSHQGVKSMFSFGKSAGFIEGVLRAYGIGYQLVPPVKWKKEFSLIGTEKRASIEVAKKLLPGVEFFPTERSRVESDGMADAALLSLFAKRNF
jgi:crossover junction endodeoxyribonuclease RuvC